MVMRGVTFFVDELLWMIAWGSYQLTLGIIFTWFLFILMGRMRLFSALLLTLGSYAFAILTYFVFVSSLLINFFQWKFIGGGVPDVFNPLDASLFLGGILSVLQLFFYMIINYWRPFPVVHFFVLSLISNLVAAGCGSFFIRVTF
ncbi:MAG TPA: hypothetical protein VKU36_01915 [Candidatus Babeliales bacterium]|jgi:hypothetical protein|nr:hypothetical protein [Candidatus Babeliales bacterium]